MGKFLNSSSLRVRKFIAINFLKCSRRRVLIPYRNSTPFGYFDYKDISKGLAKAPGVCFLTSPIRLFKNLPDIIIYYKIIEFL